VTSGSTDPVGDRRALALRAAREAGILTLEYFRRPGLAVTRKGDGSPVTEADRRAEELLRARISRAFPGDAIQGEELGTTAGTSGFEWVLDPIDGTRTFVQGVPLYGTLIAVLQEGRPEIGVIHCPALGETVHAARGRGAVWILGEEIRTARISPVSDPARAVFCTTSLGGFESRGASEVLATLTSRTGLTRTWGDCYGYLLVATGRAEIMVDPRLARWDAAALLPVLAEAGGAFTDWQGNDSIEGGDGVATNGHLHDRVISWTRRKDHDH